VRVKVRAGCLLIVGVPRTMAGRMAIETLTGREAAVERAIALAFERGPELARLLAERRAGSEQRRRGRKTRTKKNLSSPAAALGSSTRGKSCASYSAREPSAVGDGFSSLDGEPA
jgi:hypothetical protein